MGYVSLLEDALDSLSRGLDDAKLRVDRVRAGKATTLEIESLAQQIQAMKALAERLSQWIAEIEVAVTEPELDLVFQLKPRDEEIAKLRERVAITENNNVVLQRRFAKLDGETKKLASLGPLPTGLVTGSVVAIDPGSKEGIVRSDEGGFRCVILPSQVISMGALAKGDKVKFRVERRFHYEAKSVQRLATASLVQSPSKQSKQR